MNTFDKNNNNKNNSNNTTDMTSHHHNNNTDYIISNPFHNKEPQMMACDRFSVATTHPRPVPNSHCVANKISAPHPTTTTEFLNPCNEDSFIEERKMMTNLLKRWGTIFYDFRNYEIFIFFFASKIYTM